MDKLYKGLFLVFLLPLVVFAGTENEPQRKTASDANITGHAVDAQTGEHLPYITVSVRGTTFGASTDATGHYFLKNLPEGEFVLVATALGYGSAEQTVRTVAGKTMEVNFSLQEEAVGMDEVVVSATRNETSKKGAATIVNVASAKLFEGTASSNLAETMGFQPGLRVENNCGNCGITQLRINGLEGQYSQILLDSRPIFSSLASVYGLEQLPVSMIERVEVVRGGGSALFGSSAIGGVVNIITKEPLRNSVSLANTTNVLENGNTDINTSLNGSFVSDDYRAGVYLFGMLKDREGYDRNGDGFTDVPQLNSETAGFRAYYKTSAYSKITAEYHHIREFRRGGDNLDRPPHEAMIAEQLNHKINGGGLRFDLNSPDYKHRLGLYASFQDIKRDSYFGTDMSLDRYGKTKDRTFVTGAQYTYGFDKCLFMPSELTGGIEYNYNTLSDRFLGIGRELRQKIHIVGGFLQNEWKNDKVGVLIGARIDKHNLMNKAIFSPRATLRYSPNDRVGLRASYSSGYRAPQAYSEDLHVEAVGGVLSIISIDPDLRPEYSHSLSASADLYHDFGRLQTNLLIEGFYTLLDDVFTLDKISEDGQGNIYWERRNGAGATVKGLNFEAKLGMPGIFELQMGYTLQQSRYKEPEHWSDAVTPQRKMFRAPDRYGYFTSQVTVTRDFRISVFGNYTGPMLVQHLAGYVERDTERMTSDFFDLGTKLAYNFRLSKSVNLELNCGVKNIFDSYQKDLDRGPLKDAGYVYGPALPRMYFVGVKFTM